MSARPRILPVWLPNQGCSRRCSFCNQTSVRGQALQLPPDGRIVPLVEAAVAGTEQAVELAFFGGTFTGLPVERQEQLLEQASELRRRGIVCSIRISTHPLEVTPGQLERLERNGVETIELGIQSLNADVLRRAGRGYGPQEALASCEAILGEGFSLVVQLMPFLPGASLRDDEHALLGVASYPLHGVRLFPTLVLRNTLLELDWRQGRYIPATVDEAAERCGHLMTLLDPSGIPVTRVGLQNSAALDSEVLAGPYHPALGELARSAMLLEVLEGLVPRLSRRPSTVLLEPSVASLLRGHDRWGERRLPAWVHILSLETDQEVQFRQETPLWSNDWLAVGLSQNPDALMIRRKW